MNKQQLVAAWGNDHTFKAAIHMLPCSCCHILQVGCFGRLNEQQRVAACGDINKALLILAGECFLIFVGLRRNGIFIVAPKSIVHMLLCTCCLDRPCSCCSCSMCLAVLLQVLALARRRR